MLVICLYHMSRLFFKDFAKIFQLVFIVFWKVTDIKQLSQQTSVGLEDALKTSSRHVLKTSSTRLQQNNFTSSKTSCKDVLKTSWRRLEDLLQHVLEDEKLLRWRRLEDMSWRRLKDMSWSRLEDISWRRLEDVSEANKIFTDDISI